MGTGEDPNYDPHGIGKTLDGFRKHQSNDDQFVEGFPETKRPLSPRDYIAAISKQYARSGTAGLTNAVRPGPGPGGVITNRIQEQLDVLSQRVSMVAGLAGETADRLFGSEPQEVSQSGPTGGMPGELGVISGLFDRLTRQLDALEHHVRRLTPL